MDGNFWSAIAGAAGLAGIAVALVIRLFRDIIARNFFSTLTPDHSFQIVSQIIRASFTLGVICIIAWLFSGMNLAVTLGNNSPISR